MTLSALRKIVNASGYELKLYRESNPHRITIWDGTKIAVEGTNIEEVYQEFFEYRLRKTAKNP